MTETLFEDEWMIGGHRVSGFVITYNEEDYIENCLESLRWVDELVVVDSHSDDHTVEVARRYTDNIVLQEFLGHARQTAFAAEQTTMPWVMWLDADERLTQQALDEIREFLSGEDADECAGMSFPRKTFFMDRWITHSGWYPKHKLRLFHRDRTEMGGEGPVPEVIAHGEVRQAEGDILHLTYPRGIVDMMDTSNDFTTRAARVRREGGRRMSWCKLLLEPPFEFLKKFLLQLGFLDGFPGLVISAGSAYYKFIREAKMWELDHLRHPPEFSPPELDQGA